ncbi:putative ankyrin repeat domain-containing protein 20A5 [Plecturocebus cupreus]
MPAPSGSPICLCVPGSGSWEPGGHRGAGAKDQGRAGPQVLGFKDPVYTASGHQIWGVEPRKIHRAAVGATPRRWRCMARRSGDMDAQDKPHRRSLLRELIPLSKILGVIFSRRKFLR